MYQLNDRVMLIYRVYDETGMNVIKVDQIAGTVTRVWANQKDITILTDNGKTYVRRMTSLEVRHIV